MFYSRKCNERIGSTYSRGLKAKSHKTGLARNVLIINNATFHIRDIEHRERINRITLQLTTFNQDSIFYVIYTNINRFNDKC